ncbi:hypothetical protein SVIOM74S_02367 [Streptomyces violarus]
MGFDRDVDDLLFEVTRPLYFAVGLRVSDAQLPANGARCHE